MQADKFQGSNIIELFVSQGKDPLENWGKQGNVKKQFDKEIKSFIVDVENPGEKIFMPKTEKKVLGIVQHFLFLQCKISAFSNFQLELVFTDTSSTRRRILFTQGAKEAVAHPLHLRLPNHVFKKGVWLNLTIDYVSLINNFFTGSTFKFLDQILISSSVKLRRIFTLKIPIESHETVSEYKQTQVMSAKHAMNPKSTEQEDQLINYGTYNDMYDATSTNTKSPEKPSKNMKGLKIQAVNLSPGKSVQSGKESKLDSSILSTKAFAKNAMEEDGLKRDSDAFVMASISQNQRKQKLDEQLRKQKKSNIEEQNNKLKKIQEVKEQQELVAQEMQKVYSKKHPPKQNPQGVRVLKDSTLSLPEVEQNPFMALASQGTRKPNTQPAHPLSPSADLDSDKENLLDTNKFNTYNEFKLNYDEIEEEEFEEDEQLSHSHQRLEHELKVAQPAYQNSFNKRPTEEDIDVAQQVHLVDRTHERSYTPPIKDVDADLYGNDGGADHEPQFNDSLVENPQQGGGLQSPHEGGGIGDEDEMLDLHYDPILDCYVDPKTNLQYEIDEEA